jgi:hypothetical protein
MIILVVDLPHSMTEVMNDLQNTIENGGCLVHEGFQREKAREKASDRSPEAPGSTFLFRVPVPDR